MATSSPRLRDGLEDLSFLLPFRCDCPQRVANLRAVTSWIGRHFRSPVLVGGEDLDEVEAEIADSGIDMTIVPVDRLDDRRWRPAIVRNALASKANTRLIALWDVDVWCASDQVREAAAMLRSGNADFVLPYGGTFVHVESTAATAVAAGMDAPGAHHGTVTHPSESVGGAVLFNAEVYELGGMENTAMIQWGPDDRERIARFSRLGYRGDRVEGLLYHLDHDRPHERYYGHPDYASNFDQLGFTDDEFVDVFDERCPVCRTIG
jgi:hypothetical protein